MRVSTCDAEDIFDRHMPWIPTEREEGKIDSRRQGCWKTERVMNIDGGGYENRFGFRLLLVATIYKHKKHSCFKDPARIIADSMMS